MPPPLPLLCSSAFVVVLLLLLCRPLGANGRAAPPGASPPSPGAPAGQPVQQVAPAVNGTVAAAGLPAAAAPPPLGRMDQSFLLFYGVSVCYYCCGVVLGWVLDPRFHGVSSAKFRLLGFWLRACTSFFLKKNQCLFGGQAVFLPFGMVGQMLIGILVFSKFNLWNVCFRIFPSQEIVGEINVHSILGQLQWGKFLITFEGNSWMLPIFLH
jgi:hypothetical protein